MSQNILLVDDHQVFSSSLKLLLNNNGYTVTTVTNANDALKYLKSVVFDLVLTDIEMPGLTGVDFVQRIFLMEQELKNMPKIIVLTSFKKISLFKTLYTMGVNGYLSKNVSSFDLLTAIKKVLNNHNYYDQDIYANYLTTTTDITVTLTKREKDVLQHILEEKTTSEIATILNISPHTVEGHRKNLLQKTNSKNVVGLIKYTLNNNLFNTP